MATYELYPLTAVITKDGIESAHCFFHQKHTLYVHTEKESVRDHIEWSR